MSPWCDVNCSDSSGSLQVLHLALAMGDMKTPDFDDLLAAFDIPDIDAKEAIQSSPDEERDEVETDAEGREGGSPPCFPGPPAAQSDPPVVSVIVKNTVRSESFEEEDKSVGDKIDNPSSSALASQLQVKVDGLSSELGPELCADAAIEAQITNGFKGSVPRDQGRSSTESWPQPPPLRSSLNEGEDNKEGKPALVHGLRPLLYPQPSATSGPTFSPPHSPPSISPQLSPRSPQKDDGLDSNPLSSPLSQNGNMKTGIKHVLHTDEDDSEPDLGSPLVIQESPESIMSSPPKFKHRAKLQSELLGSPESKSCHVSQPPVVSFSLAQPQPQLEEGEYVSTPSSPPSGPQPQSPQDSLPSVSKSSALVQEEKYPEHVIDERDSPESPPPSETGLVVPNRSSSPDPDSKPGPALNNKEFRHQEELMESEQSAEDKPGAEEMSEKVTDDGENLNEENYDAGADDTLSDLSVLETVSSPLRPLKVKIKTPSGSITRTVTGVAPKRNGKAPTKAVDGLKPSLERHNTRSKRGVLQQSQLSAVAMLQDACAATLENVSTAKDKSTVDFKPKVCPTAVSITKTAALPSVSASSSSSSSKVSPGAMSLRGLGQKTLNSGVTLPTPLPLLPPQSSSRPASIVNSTGAIISKSQTNLVEAFNKILNNKNLLPSYKPDLSAPLPPEWGIPLPAQVSCH